MTKYPFNRLATLRLLVFCAVMSLTPPGNILAAPGYTPVRSVDDGISNPFAVEVMGAQGVTGNAFPLFTSFAIPAGKRAEITEISGQYFGGGSKQLFITIQATMGGVTVTHRLGLLIKETANSNFFLLPMTQVHLYADPGTTVKIAVVYDAPPGAGTGTGFGCDTTLTGRLVNQ